MTEPIAEYQSAASPRETRPAERARIKGLDVLRGLAAFSVVLTHYTSNYDRVFRATGGHLNGKPLHSFFNGALGVQLFFIISGFVIFMTLERCRKPMDFVRSRFSRLFPAFWTAIIVTAVILHLFHLPGRTASLPRIAANFTMVPGLFNIGPVDPVYWTLQVELCFYAIMLVLFAAGQLRRIEWFLLGLVVLNVAWNRILPGNSPLLHHHAHLALILGKLREVLILNHVSAFLLGVMVYKGAQNPRLWHLGIIAVCFASIFYYAPRIDFFATLAFAALVYSAARGWLWPLENRVLIYLGFISYSLYLTHQNIGYVVIRKLEGHGVSPNVAILAAIAVALLIASAMAYFVEQPALRLLRKKKDRSIDAPATSARAASAI